MSTISIRKTSITSIAADVIVNAANEGLWAGGGVCGAIFSAAGHDKLKAACNAIGHCDIGSAVITPGFNLPAKYIIHAVGPVWRGGNNGEPELLYGAYKRSLALAVENWVIWISAVCQGCWTLAWLMASIARIRARGWLTAGGFSFLWLRARDVSRRLAHGSAAWYK